MKRDLVLTPKFRRAFRKFVRRNKRLQRQIEETLQAMRKNVFASELGTHKLFGKLFGNRACSCGYDCRIIFSIEKDDKTNKEIIILLDIGAHHEVY